MKRLLAAVLLLCGLAVAADRVAVHVADRQVAARIRAQAGLSGTPDVDIAGFPFLTQVVAGRYRDVHIVLTSAALGLPAGARADVWLQGVRLPVADVLRGSVRQLPVDRVDGTVTVPWSLLAAQMGGDTSLRPDGGGVAIARTVRVGGRPVPVTAVGRVALRGDTLAVDATQVSAAGARLPAASLRQAADQVRLRYRVPALPFGLTLTGVHATPEGLSAAVAATGAVLRG